MPNICLPKTDIILRQFEFDDIEELYEFRNDESITEGLVGFSVGYSKKDLNNWIESLYKNDKRIVWCIANKDNECIGHVGLYNIDYRVRKASIGTLIGNKNYWGEGLGTKLKEIIISYGFNNLNLNRIQSRVLNKNIASLKINKKLGFTEEGILREYQYKNGKYLDLVIMSILRNEWKSSYEVKNYG